MSGLLTVMGVLNVTPNSFSDGGEFTTLESFHQHFHYLLASGCHVIDIGAESTAPFNDAITDQEERRRLEPVLTYLKKQSSLPCLISLDTYKPNIAHWFFSELGHDRGVWNDVSGLADQSVHDFLKEFPHHHYLLGHSRIKKRFQVTNHMDFITEDDIVVAVCEHFKASGLLDYGPRIVLDPCFGFSKSYQQNWHLIDHFSDLEKEFPHHSILVGLSKKSFLRRRVQELMKGDEKKRDELLPLSEFLHFDLLKHHFFPGQRNHPLWIRLHNPGLAHLASMSLS